MDDIKIEHNVPMVVNRRKFPFDRLAVGDSFAISPEDWEIESLGISRAMQLLRGSLVSSARSYSRRHGVKIVVRKFNTDTYRIYRLEDD